jgi:hypothetical protein
MGVSIKSGPTADTPAMDLPRADWPELAQRRRASAAGSIGKKGRVLLFFVRDAQETGDWMGYSSRDAYLREGLGIEPAFVDWVEEGMRIENSTPDAERRSALWSNAS